MGNPCIQVGYLAFCDLLKTKREWVNSLRRKNFVPSKTSKVCSKHFTEDCFNMKTSRPRLKVTAVPTIFDFPRHLMPKVQSRRATKRLTFEDEGEDSSFKAKLLPVLDSNPAVASTSHSNSNDLLKNFRYIRDFTEEDMNSPSKARKALQLAKDHCKKSRLMVRNLQVQCRRLKEKLTTLQDLLKVLKKEKTVISVKLLGEIWRLTPDNRLTHISVSVLRCDLRLSIAMKPKTSAIWNFFCEIDSNIAKSNICKRIYSRKGGTRTSLKWHLKALHRDKYEELLRLEKEPRLATERDQKTQLEKAKLNSSSDPSPSHTLSPLATPLLDIPTSPQHDHSPSSATSNQINKEKGLSLSEINVKRINDMSPGKARAFIYAKSKERCIKRLRKIVQKLRMERRRN
ncbi:hypothetical protein J437_LFUL008396 [Ladona fulva]|uniref:THAP-type domain-containing protein n=1 Tax=Ladona fulva TaxID=123851 RepID=A0A8K0P1B9_LADFU|nr:hypothetical protein J437_LFUL008396 [Ladona fulva]